MSLLTNVQARIPNARLVELTRGRGDTTSTTADETLLGLACTDVEACLLAYAGVTYDDSTPKHVAIAVPGVVLLLEQWKGPTADHFATRWNSWMELVRSLRPRVSPTTSSELTPTEEVVDSAVVPPDFDDSVFDDICPT